MTPNPMMPPPLHRHPQHTPIGTGGRLLEPVDQPQIEIYDLLYMLKSLSVQLGGLLSEGQEPYGLLPGALADVGLLHQQAEALTLDLDKHGPRLDLAVVISVVSAAARLEVWEMATSATLNQIRELAGRLVVLAAAGAPLEKSSPPPKPPPPLEPPDEHLQNVARLTHRLMRSPGLEAELAALLNALEPGASASASGEDAAGPLVVEQADPAAARDDGLTSSVAPALDGATPGEDAALKRALVDLRRVLLESSL